MQAVTIKMCMLDAGAGEEATRTRWRTLAPKHLQMTEWVYEDDDNMMLGVRDFASFKLAARPGLV